MGGLFGGNSAAATTSAPTVSSLRVQTTVLGRCIPWVFGTTRVAPNLVQYDDFKAIAHTEKQAAGGKGGGGGSTSTTSYTYTAALILAMCRGEIDGVGRIWVGKEQKTAQQLNIDVYTGSDTQTPHPHWSTLHPTTALTYRGTAYAASAAYDLGDSGEVQSHNFEIYTKTRISQTIPDAPLASVATAIISDKIDGLGIDASLIDLTQFNAFCTANSIWASPCYDEQIAAQEALTRIAEIGHSAIVDSEGKLKLIPYADTAATGNGVTFTPNATPIYDLTEDDFLDQDQPIKITRLGQADADNHFQILYYNRDADYNEATAEARDQGCIDKFGLRTREPDQYHEICDPAVAQMLVNFQKDRALSVRNTYEFRLSIRYCLLEPMDIVTLTYANDGLDKYAVRITSVEEDDNGDLTIKAEDCPLGTQTPAQIPHQDNNGTSVDFNVAAGSINQPVTFEPSLQLTQGAPQVWAAVSGGQNWGGAQVWVSLDGSTYSKIGVVTAPARQGVLTAPLALGAIIDTANTLAVSTNMSGGVLLPASQVEADAGATLFYADGELMAYRDATLTGVNTYNLGYLVRGQYGTTIAAHAAGTNFARLDDAVFKFSYQPDWVGKTIHLKFVSYNKFGTGMQSLADVTAYDYTIVGAPLPPVTNLAEEGTWTGEEAKIRWDLVDGATSYEVQVYAGSPAVLERTVTTVTEGRFTYSLDMLQKDGVASRSLIFKVRAISITGNKSPWAQVVCNNPQIGALSGLSVTSGMRQAFFECVKPSDADFAGIIVWLGTSSTFAVSDTNKVYDGVGTVITLAKTAADTPLLAGVAYYVKAAGYDAFGKDALNVSASLSFTVSANVPDANTINATMIQPAILTTAMFASGIEPVTLVIGTTVPTVKSTTVISVNGKLYRWNGTAYVASVASTDITGTIAAAQITSLAASQITGQLTSAQIVALDAAKVSGQLTAAQIASIASTQITGQLTDSQVAAVSAAKVTGQITATQITDSSITTPKIAAGAVTAASIAANTITAAQIAANAITASELAAGSITTAKIAAGAVTAASIAANTITASQIAANAITAAELAAGSITAGKIAAGAVTATELSAGSVTTAKIAAGAVTTNELAANSIIAGKLAANSVVAGNVAADAVTAGTIAAGAINARELAAGAVTAAKLVVSDTTNLIPDNQLQDVGSWTLGRASTLYPSFAYNQEYTSKGFCSYSNSVGLSLGSGYLLVARSLKFTLNAGDELLAKVQLHRLGGTKITVLSRIVWYDASNNLLTPSTSIIYNGTSTAGGVVNYSASITVPAGCVTACLEVHCWRDTTDSDFRVAGVGLFRKSNGSLIVDGAIAANHITAGAILSDKLAANSIIAGKIAANAVVAGNIAADAVTATSIAAGSITGAKISAGAITADKVSVTNLAAINSNLGAVTAGSININGRFVVAADGTTSIKSATSGQRMEMDSSQVRVYDASGVLRVRMGIW